MNYIIERFNDSPFAGFSGFHYFLSGMRLILKRMNNCGKSYSNQFELFYRWNHIFIMQQKDWDCGIACCAMVLKWCNLSPSFIFRHELASRGCPVWTLDLFIFLYQTGIHAIMFTTSLDVQPHHLDYDWYKPFLEDDQSRIKEQIQYTLKENLTVNQVNFEVL
jgi:hypothetical protein